MADTRSLVLSRVVEIRFMGSLRSTAGHFHGDRLATVRVGLIDVIGRMFVLILCS